MNTHISYTNNQLENSIITIIIIKSNLRDSNNSNCYILLICYINRIGVFKNESMLQIYLAYCIYGSLHRLLL